MKKTFFRSLSLASFVFLISCSLQGSEIISSKNNLSAIARNFSNKKSKTAMVTVASKATATIATTPTHFVEPSPLNEPSADELKKFPGATIVEAAETEAPEPGKKIRVRILKTHFKYPVLRTEEVINVENNSLISRHEMVGSYFLVTLAPGEDPQTFLKRLGPLATSIIKIPADASLYRVNLASASLEALPQALDQAALATAGVSEPDFISHGMDVSESDPAVVPNNPLFQWQWGLSKSSLFDDPDDGYEKNGVGCDAVDAWKTRTDASSVIVAVIDSGIRYTHEDLAANIWNNPAPTAGDLHGWNAYGNNGDPMDHLGHGTHCAGIIGAVGNNGVGVSGVAWKVQLMACKLSEGENSSFLVSDEVTAIDYARNHGAKILSCSWGDADVSQARFDAFDRTRTAGIIVVVAAGNDFSDNESCIFERGHS